MHGVAMCSPANLTIRDNVTNAFCTVIRKMDKILSTLKAFIKRQNYAQNDGDLNVLLTGKMSLRYMDVLKKLQKLGLANTSKYHTDSFVTNNNSNKNLDFILESLK